MKNLILAAPLGTKSVIGIDPGLRTGCKCAAVDPTGAFRGTVTLFLSRGATEKAVASQTFIEQVVKTHKPAAVAIGNGTGGRETEKFIRDLLKDAGLKDILVVSVNEAGASIYSASEVAREEIPELDLTIRGAISIARRLQDPLAELVKIEPKSIGVGQYQHDVYQPLLDRKLHAVVENCVNHVGVNLNTSSASLLSYVAGIGPGLAKKIVNHRSESGAFRSRQELLKVSGLGPKAFEQAAGFLRGVLRMQSIHWTTVRFTRSAMHWWKRWRRILALISIHSSVKRAMSTVLSSLNMWTRVLDLRPYAI